MQGRVTYPQRIFFSAVTTALKLLGSFLLTTAPSETGILVPCVILILLGMDFKLTLTGADGAKRTIDSSLTTIEALTMQEVVQDFPFI